MPKARKNSRRSPSLPPASQAPAIAVDRLLGDIRALIQAAREQTARAVNSALVGLYWHIGRRVREDVLREKRAEYGQAIIATLSRRLTEEYGRGYTEKSLRHMIRFAEVFPDEAIVSALRRELSWTHFKEIIYLDDPLKRDFYAELCRIERWSTRTLQHKIGHLLYERTAVSKKPDELIADDLAALRDEDRMTPDLVFRDPYFLDVRHDNRVVIADSVSRILGRRYLSRPTYLGSKDDRDHSLLVKRWWATKCPDPRAARLAK
jgi:hypothetical protein